MNRKDFKIIADWIQKDSTVLDLGCGDSTLLDYLASNKNISGYGQIDLRTQKFFWVSRGSRTQHFCTNHRLK